MNRLVDSCDLFFPVTVPTFTLNRKESKSSRFGAFISLVLLVCGLAYAIGRLISIINESKTETINSGIVEGFYDISHSV
jgi:hypothetical protein